MSAAVRPKETLLAALVPRGLSRVSAAAYLGISPSLFDKLIAEKLMPAGKQIHGRVVWDRLALDEAFSAIPDRAVDEYAVDVEPRDAWDDVRV
jgi:hypothetical protein